MSLGNVLSFALSQVWAMREAEHRQMMQVIHRHAQGIKLTEDELLAATGTSAPKRGVEMRVDRGVAVIPIHGVIAHRAGAVGRMSSRVGTSVEHIRTDLQQALADDDVRAILLDVDSPGGSVSGIDELAAEIRAAREQKPIVAFTDGLMASAAYYLASQAEEVISAPSAVVGSIGVIASFYDDHRAAANEGFDPVVIKSVPAKGGVQANGTFSDQDRADVQREVDAFHALFLEAVAAGRGITIEEATAMGDGKVYVGRDALDRGFVDSLGTSSKAHKGLRAMVRERLANAGGAGDRVSDEDAGDGDGTMSKTIDTPARTPEGQASPLDPQANATAAQQVTQEQIEAAEARGRDAERARCAVILEGAAQHQHEQVLGFIKGGADPATALVALNADLRTRLKNAATAASTNLQPVGLGATSADGGGGATATEQPKLEGEAKWKADWAASADLRGEFLNDEQAYLAFKRNEKPLSR